MRVKLSSDEVKRRLNERRKAYRRMNFDGCPGRGSVMKDEGKVEIPIPVQEDRDYRARLQPRDLTAFICHDPLPGYSALERK